MSEIVIGGIYEHYRNKKHYKVLLEGYYTDDLDPVVVYQALYYDQDLGEHPIFVRSREEFLEWVPYEDDEILRFTYIDEI